VCHCATPQPSVERDRRRIKASFSHGVAVTAATAADVALYKDQGEKRREMEREKK
jgi:hypothetical protein